MSVRRVTDQREIGELLSESLVRSIRWDVHPYKLVFDVDLAETLTNRPYRLHRGWLVVENVSELQVNIEWGHFAGGFTVLNLRFEEPEAGVDGAVRKLELTIATPPGEVSVRGTAFLLVYSASGHVTDEARLSWEERTGLAKDDDLVRACGLAPLQRPCVDS